MRHLVEEFDAVRDEVFWTQVFQRLPVIFERNELLHGILPW
jgi:hypothetical protein